jgi:tRNA(adenine34) deaminase
VTGPADIDHDWMGYALAAAVEGELEGEVPVGAAIVRGGQVVVRSGNRVVRDGDPLAHAELIVLRSAATLLRGVGRSLGDCTLYVTLEPCAMCAGAIVLARIERLVFGAWDEKAGMVGSVGDIVRHPRLNHRSAVIGGVRSDESSALLRRFFAARRGG